MSSHLEGARDLARDAVRGMPFDVRRQLGLSDLSELSIEPMGLASGVADGTAKFVIGHSHVLHLSPPDFPHVAREEARAMDRARRRLGAVPGAAVIPLSAEGEVAGRSFIVTPRCNSLTSGRLTDRINARVVRPKVLGWIRDLAAISSPASPHCAQVYVTNLEALSADERLPSPIRSIADHCLDVVASGARPRFTPMHGDLWLGNVLSGRFGGFTIIDWRGSVMDGFGVYDLIRFAHSTRLPLRRLRSELARHEDILQIDPVVPLAAALGHILRSLGAFPFPSFVRMAEYCLELYRGAARSGGASPLA